MSKFNGLLLLNDPLLSDIIDVIVQKGETMSWWEMVINRGQSQPTIISLCSNARESCALFFHNPYLVSCGISMYWPNKDLLLSQVGLSDVQNIAIGSICNETVINAPFVIFVI